MALNSSGPISLGGSTSGQSIALELGLGTTTQISLNQTNVRTLAGVASGAIIMPTNFWGKSSVTDVAYYVFPALAFSTDNVLGAIDSSRNLYVVFNNSSSQITYLLKYDKGGNLIFQETLTGIYLTGSRTPSVAIDSNGNVIIGGVQSSSNQQPNVASLSSSGAFNYNKLISTSTSYNTSNVITDGSGNSYSAVGAYHPGFTYYPAIVTSLNSSGSVNWSLATGRSGNYQNNSLGITNIKSGNFVLFTWTPTFTFIKISTSGSIIEGAIYTVASGSLNNPPARVASNADGNVVFGYFDSNFSILRTVSLNTNTSLTYAYNLTPPFNSISSLYANGYSLTAIDSSNYSYNVFSFGYGSTYYAVYIVKLDSSGTIQWQRSINVTATVTSLLEGYAVYDINIDPAGYYVLTGAYRTQSGTYMSILKLPTDGSLQGTYSLGGSYGLYLSYVNSNWTQASFGTYNVQSITPFSGSFTPSGSSVSSSTTTTTQSLSSTTITSSSSGSSTYLNPGTYSWVCPSGVTSVSVVCVGAGGSGSNSSSSSSTGGSGGGGLGYKNNYSVTAGNSYTVQVGEGYDNGSGTGTSYFINSATVRGYQGGKSSNTSGASGGGYAGDGGGNGGSGGSSTSSGGGGGGAGGYSGNGGNGGASASSGSSGSGGGGGGGGGSNNSGYDYLSGGGGGGVFVLGQGTNGSGGTGGSPIGAGGGGGSGGQNGYVYSYGGQGGFPGGGCGGIGYTQAHCCCSGGPAGPAPGGNGAVRIVWPGSSRTFPSTSVGTP